jgi:DNA invertase Pin-like site-specific DNA recombinase
MFQLCGAFAEFERAMIRQRIMAGLKRTVAAGTVLGRKPCDEKAVAYAKELLASGNSIRSVASETGLSVGTVHRISQAAYRA